MNHYQLARLTIKRTLHRRSEKNSVGRIELSCTNPMLIDWFKAEMQSAYAALPHYSESEERHPDSGVTYSCLVRFEESDRQVPEIAEEITWRLLRELCNNGWEPYSGKTYSEPGRVDDVLYGDVYYLKSVTTVQIP